MIANLLYWFELLAVAVFALTGAIVAAQNKMDPVAYVILATVTGIGGGTIRDALLAVPAFWLRDPDDLLICAGVAVAAFLAALVYVALYRLVGHVPLAALLGFLAGFGLRAAAILFDWMLPTVDGW